MKKIFVIKAGGGSYDDAWERNLYAVEDQTQAELDVLEHRERHEQCKEWWMTVQQIIQAGWTRVREYKPTRLAPPQPVPPTRLKDKEKDQAARQEYRRRLDAWYKEMRPIEQELRNAQDAVMHEAFVEAIAKVRELGGTEAHLMQLGFYDDRGQVRHPSFDPNTDYDCEEIELR